MSRSRKCPYVGPPGSGKSKRLASRRFRKAVKQVLGPWKYWSYYYLIREYLEPEFPHPKWMTNPYEIRDFKFYSPLDERAYRK